VTSSLDVFEVAIRVKSTHCNAATQQKHQHKLIIFLLILCLMSVKEISPRP